MTQVTATNASSPKQVLAQYVRALEQDNPKAAYELLDGPPEKRIPYDTFVTNWKRSAPERAVQARAIRAQWGKPEAVANVEAIVALGNGARVRTQRSGGTTYLAQGLTVGFTPGVTPFSPSAQTPKDALRLLLLAIEERSYDAVLRLLEPGSRKAIEKEVQERADRLKAALLRNQPVETKGDRAKFQYDPRFHIDLQKNPQGWWISDLN